MELTRIPFNQMLGIETEDPATGLLVSLPESFDVTNHIGTIHAAALIAVAEAGSALALLRTLGDAEGFVPVVRRLESKFRNPGRGRVAARLAGDPEELRRQAEPLATRGRALVSVPVEVVDAEGAVVLTATVEWFIGRA